MTRLSQRVSAMWTTVKCPKCSMLVPVKKPSEVTAPPQPSQGGGKRFSFIWLMPQGDFCPECDFPLSKYFGRLKWIRTLMVGVSIVLVALVLQVIGAIGQFGVDYLHLMRDAIRVGVVVFGVGAVGVIVGKRRRS